MDNTFITQCFKAQSILLGHRTNMTGTKALTTRDSHNCQLRPTSNVSLKSSKKGIGEKEDSSWQLDTGLIPCEGLGVARRWPPVLLRNINQFCRTSPSDKATCHHDGSSQRSDHFVIMSESRQKHERCPNHKITKHPESWLLWMMLLLYQFQSQPLFTSLAFQVG